MHERKATEVCKSTRSTCYLDSPSSELPHSFLPILSRRRRLLWRYRCGVRRWQVPGQSSLLVVTHEREMHARWGKSVTREDTSSKVLEYISWPENSSVKVFDAQHGDGRRCRLAVRIGRCASLGWCDRLGGGVSNCARVRRQPKIPTLSTLQDT